MRSVTVNVYAVHINKCERSSPVDKRLSMMIAKVVVRISIIESLPGLMLSKRTGMDEFRGDAQRTDDGGRKQAIIRRHAVNVAVLC
jgi:hypothetical protein